MGTEPSDEELRAFVGSMLSNLDTLLREPEVIDEAIRQHRKMWLMLYQAGQDVEATDLGAADQLPGQRTVASPSSPEFWGRPFTRLRT